MTTESHELEQIVFEHGERPAGTQQVWVEPPNKDEFKECLSVFGYSEQDKKHLMEIDDKYCGNWYKEWDEGHTHHASFGDNGTTASISRYGDVMQVTRYLGKGRSGVFSIDQTSTSEPYQVAARAADLQGLSQTTYAAYTFGIAMSPYPIWGPPTVKWINWKWPRYEWERKDMRVVFQYMVREGVVLHQLLFENRSEEPLDLPQFFLLDEVKINDLDFLHHQVQDGSKPPYLVNKSTGPQGYGRVTIKSIQTEEDQGSENSGGSQALALIDIFVDGKRSLTQKHQFQSLGKLIPCHVKEVVVAYKLSARPEGQLSWKDLMIPAEHVNVSRFLREELSKMGDQGMMARSLRLTPQLVAETGGREEGATSSTANPSPEQPEISQEPSTKVAQALSGQREDKSRTAEGHEWLTPYLERIEYLTWRHLEHVLSVCAVPIVRNPSEGQGDKSSDYSDANDAGLVALTCGDMSGHRICTPASFYAFSFLTHIVESRIPPLGVNNKNETILRDRVRKTCEGHIEWILHVWEKQRKHPLDSGCFAANYWMTGDEMPEYSQISQPENTTTDTALQILKVTSYVSTYYDLPSDKLDRIYATLTKIFVSWLCALDKLDVRARYAWPHSKEDGVNTFRLEDHYWIWKALKAMDDLKMWTQLPSPDIFDADSPEPKLKTRCTEAQKDQVRIFLGRVEERDGFLKLICVPGHNNGAWKGLYQNFHILCQRLAPKKVLHGVLQRFTTTNDVSGSRMLAVKRSPRDTQFLLEDRGNTLVLNNLEIDGKSFFADPFKGLWNQTINVQPFHLENEEYGSRWYYVRRYLLSIMLGIEGKSLNNKDPHRALQDSMAALIGFFGHNGFLGAQLGDNREPVLFEDNQDRDFYYHVSFEVIHMLRVLTHANQKQRDETSLHKPGDAMSEGSRHAKDTSPNTKFTELIKAQRGMSRQGVAVVMKENMPSNRNIDASNICMVEEEEWVHNYPGFLSASTFQLGQACRCSTEAGSNAEMSGGATSTTGTLASRHATDAHLPASINQETDQRPLTFIADAKKQKLYGQPRAVNPKPWEESCYNPPYTNMELEIKLKEPRSARNAKKRFIWLPRADCNKPAMDLCQDAKGSDAEKQAVSEFFSGHRKCGNLYHDDTSFALNSWQTELNLSFHMLEPGREGTGENYRDRRPKGQTLEAPKLQRASMGFRFDGDMFDRYWTCHFVESVPGAQIDSGDSSKPSSEDQNPVFESYDKSREQFKQWWQRKILELLLLHRILKRQIMETRNFLDQAEQMLEKITASGDSEVWRDCKKQLQKFADDLKSTLEKLEEWNDRERKRGQEKPRWTSNDEKKYRRRIRELQNSIEKTQRDLRNKCSEVENLQNLFDHERERQHAERERQRAEREAHYGRNVRWFTYVTIVFAPLSFAEGFYSMGGGPGYDLVISLVKFCFSALAVTVAVILLTVKTMPFLKRLRNKIVGQGDGKTPWDEAVLSILRFLVFCLLYPRGLCETRTSGLLDSGMLALAFTVGVIFDMILVPVFAMFWLISFVMLNFGDLCVLFTSHWPQTPYGSREKGETLNQDVADTDAVSHWKTDENFETDIHHQKMDLEAGCKNKSPSEQPRDSLRRFDTVLEHAFNLATRPPRPFLRRRKAPKARGQIITAKLAGSPESLES